VQAPSRPVALASAAIVVLLAAGTALLCLRAARRPPEATARPVLTPLAAFALASVALLLAVTYLSGKSVALVLRYHFVYLPAVLVLAGALLARVPRAVAPAIAASLLGGLTVVTDLGYQKTHRPDLVAAEILRHSPKTVLVAISHRTHGQTGRLMGVETALRAALPGFVGNVRYLLAHGTPSLALGAALDALPRPLDVWLLDIDRAGAQALGPSLRAHRCRMRIASGAVDGYRYRAFRCRAEA
jgi:hypothetical protein